MTIDVRFASFNASLNRNNAGELIDNLSTPNDEQAQAVAEIIQRTNPDVVLINEFDFDTEGTAARLFQDNYLTISQNGAEPVEYPFVYLAPSNTGIASDFDLDNNGTVGTEVGTPDYANDAYGFGFFPGQFGMALYSQYPLVEEDIRTFQTFLWRDMPGALLPDNPDTPGPNDFYSEEELDAFRLSSKNHWDIPIEIDGEVVHVLASHPTPPVFDGEEDRNGRRNHDEIRFWSDYVTPGEGDYIYDDNGNFGGLPEDESFVIMGDQNADPFDGDSTDNAVLQLLDNPRILASTTDPAITPTSEGGPDAAQRQDQINDQHEGNPAFDTADFTDDTPGNLRVDYVLPSADQEITDAGIFWPTDEDPLFRLAGDFDPDLGRFASSDHRLVYADVAVESEVPDSTRRTVSGIEFIGEVTFPTGFTFNDTEVGGISGLTYDSNNNVYYALSDDRSQTNPARFYTLAINLEDGTLDEGDITFDEVTTLLNENGEPFPEASLDPEGIALTSDTLFISSEGDAETLIDPFINEFSLAGEQFNELPIPRKFLPTEDDSSGIRNNLAFESLTITPDNRFLYSATENALIQDGPAADVGQESLSRVIQYQLATGEPVKEFIYTTDEVASPPEPADDFRTNGLVELLALDNTGTLLSLERSFSAGVGNSLRLYEVLTQLTTDVSAFNRLTDEEGETVDVDAQAEKRLLLDFSEIEELSTLDNSEALALGPTLPDGRATLIVASDNNFSDAQTTQFLAFALDIDTIPEILPSVETPSEIRFGDPENPDPNDVPDGDDPAIYVHPTEPEQSFVITSFKDDGLRVYDLNGEELQSIEPGNIRYNNVDLVYGFQLGEETVDLAIASDRQNDTLAIFRIDPNTRQLTDITASSLSDPAFSIFGIDDGEQTAYGLATYTSPVSGNSYVFLSQREGDQIAQLELIDNGSGQVEAQVVRTFSVPIPPDGELEDAQVEGMVVDRELGYLYLAQENFGIFKFAAEPDAGDTATLVDTVSDIRADSPLQADVEGLTIYYGPDGSGYLLASSQGNSTFAVYDRADSNSFIGRFAVGETNDIDSVEESDGADITNVALGEAFPAGLLVTHDGSNEPAVVFPDPEEGEIQNYNTNFKYVDLQIIAETFSDFIELDTSRFDPRTPTPGSLINDVASGDTTQTGTILWARSTLPGTVTFEYATDSDFNTVVGTQTADVVEINVPVKVEVEGLTPGTDYFYRITDAGGDTAVGEFTTAAEVGTLAGLRFGVAGDWRGELSPYPAISNAPERNLAFFVEHGDTVYADIPSDAVKNPDGTRKEQAETLDEYRAKHSEVYSNRLGLNAWGELRSSTSILATIDDHEVINDFSGGAPTETDPRFPDTGLINDTQLYENGLQAFQEYNPLREEFYGDTGDERTTEERRLYRHNTYGSDAATFVLDTRSFRDVPLDPANFSDPADVGRFLTESLTLDRTFLGTPQLEDLQQDLLEAENSGVTWKFVVVPEPIQNLGPLGAGDRFEGYAEERTQILRFIEENNIDNVVFVAADIHGTVVNNLTYQEAPGREQIATGAFEITTGSVAFDEPFGPTLAQIGADLGLLTPEQQALYESLPVANDPDSTLNDRDDFIKQLIDGSIADFGYDPVGLNNNLDIADGLIDAALVQGDYVATHTFGWTEFDINPATQQLRVTTYGIDSYSEAELLDNPEAVLSRNPEIVSEFVVNPTDFTPPPEASETIFGGPQDDSFDAANPDSSFDGNNDLLFAGAGDDTVDGSQSPAGGNRIYGGNGNDEIFAGSQDRIFGDDGTDILDASQGSGGNLLYGGAGEDEILVSTGDRAFGDEGDDTLEATQGGGSNRLYGGVGDDDFFLGVDDRILGNEGDDRIFVGTDGGNVITGGEGADQFWIANSQLPTATNTITDFEVNTDVLGIGGFEVIFGDNLTLAQDGNNTRIAIDGTDVAILLGIQSSSLSAANFQLA